MASKFFIRNQEVFAECVSCKTEVKLNLTPSGFAAIQKSDDLIQNIPEAQELTAGERELFLSGICETCFDSLFEDDEDDDDEEED